jgi:hypothetical protein
VNISASIHSVNKPDIENAREDIEPAPRRYPLKTGVHCRPAIERLERGEVSSAILLSIFIKGAINNSIVEFFVSVDDCSKNLEERKRLDRFSGYRLVMLEGEGLKIQPEGDFGGGECGRV